MKNPFKKQKENIEDQFKERNMLLKKFIKKYKNPPIVHAIHDIKSFKQILKEGKLKLPKKHSSKKKSPYMEKILGIDNSLYYSLGFVYWSAYGWKYNLLFDLKFLKDLTYYYNSINYQCSIAVINYWYQNDLDYLMELRNFNNKTKKVVDKYLNKTYCGYKRVLFDFWKIEKETFKFINKYKDKKKLIKVIKKTERKFFQKYPNSLNEIKKDPFTTRTPEIIGGKENNLKTNPHFMGFYISGKIPKHLQRILKEKYSNKIIFDGRKIKRISEILK